jgi:hypothetical protein
MIECRAYIFGDGHVFLRHVADYDKKYLCCKKNDCIIFLRLVKYRWQLSLGETELNQEEFDTLVALKSPSVQIRGRWTQIDPESRICPTSRR